MNWLFNSILSTVADIIGQVMGLFTGDLWGAIKLAKVNVSSGNNLKVGQVIGGSFDEWFPGFMQFRAIFMTIAITIILAIFIFGLLKAMLPDIEGLEPESPLGLITRVIMATVLTGFSYQFMAVLQSPIGFLFNEVYEKGGNTKGLATTTKADEGLFTAIITENGDIQGETSLGATVVCIFFLFAILAAFIKLSLEVVERYITLSFLFYFAPLPFATIVSSKTTNIFKSYIRMYVAEGLVMIMSMCFIYVFCYAYKNPPEAITSFDMNKPDRSGEIIVYFAALLAWLRLGSRFDELLNTMGLSTAQTGAGLGRELLGGALMAGTAFKAIKGAGKFAMNTGKAGYNIAQKVPGAVDALKGGSGKIETGTSPSTRGSGKWSQIMDNALNDKNGISGDAARIACQDSGLPLGSAKGIQVSDGAISYEGQGGEQVTLGNMNSVDTSRAYVTMNGPDGPIGGNIYTPGHEVPDLTSRTMAETLNYSGTAENLQSRSAGTITNYGNGSWGEELKDGTAYQYSDPRVYERPKGAELVNVGGQQLYKQTSTFGKSVFNNTLKQKRSSTPESNEAFNNIKRSTRGSGVSVLYDAIKR